jgi:essential nuclear protein 1
MFSITHSSNSIRKYKKKQADSDAEEDIVPEDITKKILTVARQQLKDEGLEDECEPESEVEEPDQEDEFDSEADIDIDEDDEELQAQYSRVGGTAPAESSTAVTDSDLPPEIIDLYTRIGKFLSVYTTGRVPKGFKLLPSRKHWEELLYYTNPVEWTTHAHFQATRIFASNLNEKLAQRYFNLVLLPAIRSDIRTNKKLHFCLYQSLKKSLFKPMAFLRGILLPLLDSHDCTLREAVIVGSILGKMSVPMRYGASALIKLAASAEKWVPVKSILITILLNKKYSLPVQAIEALVNHFSSFCQDPRKMPVLWHASLLTFIQRYKGSLTEDQIQRIGSVLVSHPHPGITPEIRRELNRMTE